MKLFYHLSFVHHFKWPTLNEDLVKGPKTQLVDTISLNRNLHWLSCLIVHGHWHFNYNEIASHVISVSLQKSLALDIQNANISFDISQFLHQSTCLKALLGTICSEMPYVYCWLLVVGYSLSILINWGSNIISIGTQKCRD